MTVHNQYHKFAYDSGVSVRELIESGLAREYINKQVVQPITDDEYQDIKNSIFMQQEAERLAIESEAERVEAEAKKKEDERYKGIDYWEM